MTFLKKIPIATIESYFKKTELDPVTLSKLLHTIAKQITSTDDCNWAHDFIMTLTKAYKFDTTMMLAGDDLNADVQIIVEKLSWVDQLKSSQIE